MRLSFRIRLVLLNSIVVASLLFGLGAILIDRTRIGVMHSADRDLRNGAERFLAGPRRPQGPNRQGGPGGPDRNRDPQAPRFYQRVNGVVQPGESLPAMDPRAVSEVRPDEPNWTTIRVDGSRIRILTVARRSPDGEEIIQIGRDLSEYDRLVATQSHWVLILAPIAVVLAGIAGWFLANRALGPVAMVSQAASSISEDRLHTRLVVTGDDELALLAQTFNDMLDRLQGSFEQREALVAKLNEALDRQRQFTADASHELRTPLTRIKLTTSAALAQAGTVEELSEALRQADREADGMNALIQRLLELATIEHQPAASDQKTTAAEAVHRALEIVGNPPAVRVEIRSDFSIPINSEDLSRAIRNLVENAVRVSPAPDSVQVLVDKRSIQIADCGPGIESDHLARLGQRFYRADTARSRADGGTGLGISIAKAIIERAGGTIQFASTLGRGTTVSINF